VRLVPRTNLAGDLGLFTYAAQLSFTGRFSGSEFIGYPTGNELGFGGAFGVKVLDDKLILGPEIWASTVLTEGSNPSADLGRSSVEGIMGAHYRFVQAWSAGFGVGTGFNNGPGVPQVRLLGSIEWTPFGASDSRRATKHQLD
jgi:hypothetical protein